MPHFCLYQFCCLECLSLPSKHLLPLYTQGIPAAMESLPNTQLLAHVGHLTQCGCCFHFGLSHLPVVAHGDSSSSQSLMSAEAGVGACSTATAISTTGSDSLSSDPTRYQLRKHLPCLLHVNQLRARDMLRCTRVCTALLLQVWRTEVEHRFPKSVTVSRTPKSPPKSMSATKSARHSVLRQIYGKYSGYSATNTSGS